jgi:hypothetical protein
LIDGAQFVREKLVEHVDELLVAFHSILLSLVQGGVSRRPPFRRLRVVNSPKTA